MKKTAAIQSPAPVNPASDSHARKIVMLALLSALGFISMLLIKIPTVWILKYEPKDVFLTFAGFLYGPLAALACSVVSALLELPFSSTGLIGMVMNLLSSAAFSCTAALIYRKRSDLIGAVIGLASGMVVMTTTMLLWNYLITPLYMNTTREQVAPMLTTVFLPFNLLKSGLNAGLILLLFKPFLRALALCGFPVDSHKGSKKTATAVIIVFSVILLAVCSGVIWYLNK